MSALERIAARAEMAELDRAETLLQDAERALRELQTLDVIARGAGISLTATSTLSGVRRLQRIVGAAPVAS